MNKFKEPNKPKKLFTLYKLRFTNYKDSGKRINYRGHRGGGMRFLCKSLIKQHLCVLCGKSFPSTSFGERR